MLKLRIGYLVSGIITGLVLVFQFLWSLPDGKLHITFCDVGQGDAVYVVFPDGRDMLVDGGPGNAVLRCLGSRMPFWDRKIDIVMVTHPENDHLGGIVSVLERYQAGVILSTAVSAQSDLYTAFQNRIETRNIPRKIVSAGEYITVGDVTMNIFWPDYGFLSTRISDDVLGVTHGDVNETAIVFFLRYGTFDTLFTADADVEVEDEYTGDILADDHVELLKVPHHGSKTGMSDTFLDWIQPELAVISVGKNSYGHPSQEILEKLAVHGVRALRTDEEGDISIVSDGRGWEIR